MPLATTPNYIESSPIYSQEMDYGTAREAIYGMTYAEWKENHQQPATAEQLAAFEDGEKRRKGG